MVRHSLALAAFFTCAPAFVDAAPVFVGLQPIAVGFTSTLTPLPTDIWGVVVVLNENTDPIFSMDLAVPGEFIQSIGSPTVAPSGSGSILVSGVLPAADTYFSVPSAVSASNVAIAPGTAIDNETLIAAAYTIVGDTPILAPREVDVMIAVLAVPEGTIPTLPAKLGTAAVRTSAGPVSVEVSSVIPEPAGLAMLSVGLVAMACRVRRASV